MNKYFISYKYKELNILNLEREEFESWTVIELETNGSNVQCTTVIDKLDSIINKLKRKLARQHEKKIGSLIITSMTKL